MLRILSDTYHGALVVPKIVGTKKCDTKFFTSLKHIEYLVLKSRKHLNILKYIAGKNWGDDAATLTYLTLIRPILECGFPIYWCASNSALKKLEKVQLSTIRLITGLETLFFSRQTYNLSYFVDRLDWSNTLTNFGRQKANVYAPQPLGKRAKTEGAKLSPRAFSLEK
ncbi:reverse transcriptase domain-containing protein [Trichonephila clavipes]|nr:reverse transcriptase domain-containing protein [Trichonephila clavipes]